MNAETKVTPILTFVVFLMHAGARCCNIRQLQLYRTCTTAVIERMLLRNQFVMALVACLVEFPEPTHCSTSLLNATIDLLR